MTIMTIRIPGDVKEALDKAFEGQDKDAIIAQLIRDGLAMRAAKIEHNALSNPPQVLCSVSGSFERACHRYRRMKSGACGKKAAHEARYRRECRHQMAAIP